MKSEVGDESLGVVFFSYTIPHRFELALSLFPRCISCFREPSINGLWIETGKISHQKRVWMHAGVCLKRFCESLNIVRTPSQVLPQCALIDRSAFGSVSILHIYRRYPWTVSGWEGQ